MDVIFEEIQGVLPDLPKDVRKGKKNKTLRCSKALV